MSAPDLLAHHRGTADWRSSYGTAPATGLYAGDPPQEASALIPRWQCTRCARRFFGETLVQPRCPDCKDPLQQLGMWDLIVDAFLPFFGEGERP